MKVRLLPAVLCALLVPGSIVLRGAPPTPLDQAFEAYWKADSPKAAASAASKVLAAGAAFDEVLAHLRQGRPYEAGQTGVITLRYPSVDGTFENRVTVPADYRPDTPLALRVQLHGGINRPEPGQIGVGRGRAQGSGANRIEGERQIYVEPSGWAETPWWSIAQIENILRLVDTVKRRYNVDETQVYLTGISDGGTGSYYIGTREATLWATIMPLNGSILVLRNPSIGVAGDVFPENLSNTPFYIVNGGRDPLYPVQAVTRPIDWLQAMGVPLVFRPQPDAGHDTSWWPTERARYEAFVHDHRRDAHPGRLSWQTERTDRFNRVKWLVIDKLGRSAGEATFPEVGVFAHRNPGRVDIERRGNTFTASTRGVQAFRLLLSPDVVDFSQPVTVVVNGRQRFAGTVQRDPRVLLAWNARDNDRTMLYGAELPIAVD